MHIHNPLIHSTVSPIYTIFWKYYSPKKEGQRLVHGIICKVRASFSMDIVIFICACEQLLQEYAYGEYSLKDSSCGQATFLSYCTFSNSETLPRCQIARLFLIPAHTTSFGCIPRFLF